MPTPSLRPDCSRCAALCCVALAFDKSEHFALDKPAGQPCPNLDASGGCRIHAVRAERGFGGCIAYDCLGAGQRVTQEVFGGRTWLREPELLAAMADAFHVLTRAHRLLELLAQAKGLPLEAADQARRDELEGAVVAAGAGSVAVQALETETRAFLRGLSTRLPARPPPSQA